MMKIYSNHDANSRNDVTFKGEYSLLKLKFKHPSATHHHSPPMAYLNNPGKYGPPVAPQIFAAV
jgi:hypothetical protein